MINIEDFIPVYDYGDIYSKKEFNELELSEREPIGKGLLSHQKLIARLLSPYTPYDELFLFHSAGTGKSCSAIGTIELAIKQMPDVFKKAVVILPNAELLRKFLYEIVYTCSDGQYKPDELEPDDPRQKQQWKLRMAKKATAGTYQLHTHESFYNQILSISNLQQLKRQFNDSIIVIDEVHRLVDSNLYDAYWAFLHSLSNRKILLLSGTPMKNNYDEISPLMNLIMPDNKQLPKKPSLNDITMCKGRVSFLRANTGIVSRYIGNVIQPLQFLKLYYSRMSDFQYSVYSQVYDEEEKGLRPESINASLMVFPNGMSGKEGFNHYVRRSRRGNYIISREFTRVFRGDYHENLRILDQFSSKYAEVIRHILNNPTQNIFIYCENIKGSGAIMLGYCLEQFGLSRLRSGGKMKKAQRYAILSPTMEDNGSLEGLLNTFNQKSNKNGEYLRVLIGGSAVSEGFTFRSIQQIHIVQPHWNLSTLDQVVARGVRLGAHRFLGSDHPVSIFRHVSVHSGPSLPIDVEIYKIAEDKDLKIKRAERVLKEIALDCQLTRSRNIIRGQDDTRECDYGNCEYKCAFPDWKRMQYDTYYQYYLPTEDVIGESNRITEQLKSVGTFDIDEKTTELQLHTIKGLLYNVMPTQYGNRWVGYNNGQVYLAPSPRSQNRTDVFYSFYPDITPYSDMKYYMEQQFTEIARDKIRSVVGYSLDDRMKMLESLPAYVQSYFVESAIDAVDEKEDMVHTILNKYNKYIYTINDVVYVTVDNRILRKREMGKWENGTDQDKILLLKSFVNNNKRKVFGKLERGQFIIVDLKQKDTLSRLLLAGKACSSYNKKEQIDLMKRLKITSTGKTNEDRCEILLDYFKTHEIIFYDGL